MWKLLSLALVAFGCGVSAESTNFASSPVFIPAFYLNNNPEVVQAGYTSPTQARDHWMRKGMQGGLQGTAAFHSRQYLQRYPDLAAKFGQNYTAAVEHYLTKGKTQGLLGYVEGGYEGRYTISQGSLFISASTRVGGAVDSVVFDNTEFINAWDHGRELQVAMTMLPNGECFNPTEGGGRDDQRGAATTTKIQSISSQNGMLSTTVLPAFWLKPGDKETQDTGSNCTAGSPALNTQDVYPYPFSKNITFGCPGADSDPCFTYSLSVVVGGSIPKYTTIQVEGPTGYHTGEFNTTKSLDVTTGALVDFDTSKPLVFSTWCLQHAFGIWAPPGQDPDYSPSYASMHFVQGQNFADATQKWSVVWRTKAVSEDSLPMTLNYKVYICVGTQIDAAKCTMKLFEHHNKTY
ncbi:uncharacterized protein [Littorina saxatilis]|uniref:Uncharacterized protein n=1 Tax=Littorina saxatilis TaxID=31220 RepID=A0AAN9BZM8_9CAEN